MRRQSSSGGGLLTIVMLLVAVGGFGFLLFTNARPARPLTVVIPTQSQPTEAQNPWQDVLQPDFGDNTTPLPTIEIPQEPFVAPTIIPLTEQAGTPIAAADLMDDALFTLAPVSEGTTPTPIPPTLDASGATAAPEVQAVGPQQPTIPWQPPPLAVPRNEDPLGRDHYVFQRPVDSSGQNFGNFAYPYGSTGLGLDSALRIHHGIDMPNPIGTTIRAAGSGTVLFASSEEEPYFQSTFSYGNIVVIEHDFGWQGQALYTLYAHLEAPLVSTGDLVEAGDPIGLNGNTGGASGAHVHFEVRLGQNTYGSTVNPVLWLAPYVGHGTIAGRLVNERNEMIDEATITLRDWATTLFTARMPTYIFDGTVNQVNSDPNWEENFVFSDIPVGRYEVIAEVDGIRYREVVDVFEGRTSFVLLAPPNLGGANTVSQQATPEN